MTEPFPGSISISQVGVLWFHVDIAGAPGARRRRPGRGERDRGVVPGRSGAARARGGAERKPAAAVRRLRPTRSTSTSASSAAATGPRPSPPSARSRAGSRSSPASTSSGCSRRSRRRSQAPPRAHSFLAAHPPRVRYDGFACAGTEIAADHALVTTLVGEPRAGRGERHPSSCRRPRRPTQGCSCTRAFRPSASAPGPRTCTRRRTRQHPLDDHRRAGTRRLHPRLVRGVGR